MSTVPLYASDGNITFQLNDDTIEKTKSLSGLLAIALKTQDSLESIFAQHQYSLYELNADIVKQVAPHYDAEGFLDQIVQEIDSFIDNLSLDNSTLDNTFRENFVIYQDILKRGDFKHAIPQVNELPPYQDYINFLESRQPTAHRYLEAGLMIEMSRMLFDLYKAYEVLDEKRVEELAQFLTGAIQVYSAYCILLGYWKPNENETNSTIEGIRLYHSKLQAELGMTARYYSVEGALHPTLAEEGSSLYSPPSNIQQELLNLYAQNISDQDLENIKDLIANYFAEKAMNLADQIWDEKGWTEEDSKRLANTRMRTPYNSQNG